MYSSAYLKRAVHHTCDKLLLRLKLAPMQLSHQIMAQFLARSVVQKSNRAGTEARRSIGRAALNCKTPFWADSYYYLLAFYNLFFSVTQDIWQQVLLFSQTTTLLLHPFFILSVNRLSCESREFKDTRVGLGFLFKTFQIDGLRHWRLKCSASFP